MRTAEPVAVEIWRGDNVESIHLVDAVAVDADGSIVSTWGDHDRAVMPRSAVKPIQALSLERTGAAEAFGLTDVERALSCASHGGEPGHVDAVASFLAKIGSSPAALECGPHVPSYRPAADDLVAQGIEPDARHNNCSGKHTGFLAVCAHLGIDPSGYIKPDHSLQRDYITPALEDACEVSLAAQRPATDGCGMPTWTIPLESLALGWAKLGGDPAGKRLTTAMMAEPFYIAGTGRSCTDLMVEAGPAVAVKTGAEGVYCALLVDEGVGIALKARDGAARAADAAIRAVLASFGLAANEPSTLHNWVGTVVGSIRANADRG